MTVSPAAEAAQQLAAYYGALVTGGAKTLPASTTGHLFTVAGGRVMITSVTGVVSTVIQAQACTISIGNTPTGGSAATTSIATASSSVSGVAVGASFGVPAFSSGAAALVFTGASGVLAAADIGISLDDGGICLCPAGTVDWTTSATNTGAVTWTLGWVPYDSGASVVAI
jgi:hypothetical protein